jgi:hypothetical protein
LIYSSRTSYRDLDSRWRQALPSGQPEKSNKAGRMPL